MRVVRAFPDSPPPGRPHIIDGWPRIPVDNYDYRTLAGVGDDVISMDWDTACSLEDLRFFANKAAESCGAVLVAPMRCYVDGANHATDGRWNVGYVTAGGGFRPADPYSGKVHLFGFGMVYLPHALIARFIDENPGTVMSDAAFAEWHYRRFMNAAVDWGVRPVHLHYPEAERGRL